MAPLNHILLTSNLVLMGDSWLLSTAEKRLYKHILVTSESYMFDVNIYSFILVFITVPKWQRHE